MLFSEPYLFVLAISCVLCIPLGVVINRLLATKEWVVSANQLIPSIKEDIMVTVDQLMAKSLVKIESARSAMEAAKLMKTHKIGSVLVKRDNHIVGIVTESDIIRRVIAVERIPYYVPVEEIMSSPVIGIDRQRPIIEAADMMNHHRTRHLAVFNGDSVIGVVSVRDLLQPVSVDEF
jgi:signal-transduction protein with cAMP-binding, CBS, and nucleotidyltransferase domain